MYVLISTYITRTFPLQRSQSSVWGKLIMRTPTIAVIQLYRDIRRQVKVRFRLYTRWVAHVEQVLRILPENYMSSPIFIGVSVARSLVFGVEYCILLIVLFLFLLVIVLSVIPNVRLLIIPLVSSNCLFIAICINMTT